MRRFFLLFSAATLAACSLLPGPRSPTASPGPATAGGIPRATSSGETPPAQASPVEGTPRATPPGVAVGLRVWLPPEFTPAIDSAGGQVLAQQIQAFETAHPGTAVEIRTKADSGAGGLLNSLATAANAAPSVLPDVIALSRDDLATATAAGLVAPLDGALPANSLSDYFPFAQALARVGGVWVGLPFAADARVLAYLDTSYAGSPLRWTDMLTGPIALPVAESSGLTLLSSYLAAGGTLADANNQLHLDPDVLATTLQAYQRLQLSGLVLPATLDYADPATTWQALRERRAAAAATDAGRFLAEYFRVSGATATLLPTGGDPPLALADGWVWALVNTSSDRHAVAAELVDWLSAPAQNGPWTEAAGVLPARAGSLAVWRQPRLAAIAAAVVVHAQLQPPTAVLAVLGPALQEAFSAVMNGRATPFAAATVAAAAVNQP